MGICQSKKKTKIKGGGGGGGRQLCSSAAPPEEEAVVKQVLTETPTMLPRAVSLLEDRSYEASESCSLSESFVSKTPSEADEISAKSIFTPAEKKTLHRHRRPQPPPPHQWRRPHPVPLVRDAGERSGRRSPSQAAATMRREAGERSGRMAASPAALRKDNGERSGRRSGSPAAKRLDDRRAPGSVSRSSSMRKAAPPAHLDSMENPLVSLECFIFL